MRSLTKLSLCALVLCAALSSPAPARVNAELSLNSYIVGLSLISELKNSEFKDLTNRIFDSFILRHDIGFGLGFEGNIFFGSPLDGLELGLHTALEADGMFGTKVDARERDTDIDDPRNEYFRTAGGGGGLKVGAAIRSNIGPQGSITLTPAIRAKVRLDNSPIYRIAADLSATLGIGYRHWLYRRGNFEVALAAGADFAVPLLGSLINIYSQKNNHEIVFEYTYIGGFEMRFSVGCVFNFGKRSVRK